MSPPAGLFRVTPDDPRYRQQAVAEAEFWQRVHPLSLEATECQCTAGPVQPYVNTRFTGDARTNWSATIARWGTFRRGLMIGTASLLCEARVLETNPHLHLTFLDLSAGPLERRAQLLGERFPGRVATETGDLNFAELGAERFDLIVSSSTIHHVTNLEHLAFQINAALTPEGYFFLEDYVGEPRFAFSEAKRRLYEILYERDLARQRGRRPGLVWRDDTDLSPFCGVRSDEILDVFRAALDEVQVRTAATLTIPMARSRPVDLDEVFARIPRWKFKWAAIRDKLGLRRRHLPIPELVEDLCLVGDAASDAGLVRPGVAFAVYRKRPTLGAGNFP